MDRAKVAIVTGASSGIGLALARAFINRGYGVIGNGRTLTRLNKASEALGSPARFVPVEGDLGRPEIGRRLFAPGIIETPMHSPAALEAMKALSPMRRIGSVEQIVAAALYLVDTEFVRGVA